MLHNHRILILFLVLATGLGLAATVFPAGAMANTAILYAAPTPSGSGDCSGWADACTLQTALSNAVSRDQIWVQEGLHKPGATVSDTFALVNGVAIYGGFAGTETSLEQRNWETNITVLSGDIDNNDLADSSGIVTDTANIMGDNAYHVVSSTGVLSTTLLDGFFITAGQADTSFLPNDSGGGMYNDNSSPILTNLNFIGNMAYARGGGMFNDNNSNLILLNITFNYNKAQMGGGMFNFHGSNPKLIDVSFLGNSGVIGGGLHNIYSSPTLTATTILGNFASWGGGMFSQSSSPILMTVTFGENSASIDGGGMYNSYSTPSMTDVIFESNTANEDGGGMLNTANSNPTLTSVTFYSNTAKIGGGIYNDNSDPSLTDATFDSNIANFIGGGIYNDNASNLTLIDVIFSANSAISGGGLYNRNSSTSTLIDVTFIENIANMGGGVQNTSASLTLTNVSFSDNVATGSGGGMANDGNAVLTNVTFNGNSASAGGGIFEGSNTSIFTNVTFVNNSSSYGGGMYMSGNQTLMNVIFDNNSATSEGGGIHNTGDSNPTLVNVTFSNNTAGNRGGGLFNAYSSSPSLTDVTFNDNSASNGGGMFNMSESNPVLVNVTFNGNSATTDGGGMVNTFNSSPVLTNVTFINNFAGDDGGGLLNSYYATLTNVVFRGNSVADNGGGMYNVGGTLSFTNVTLSGNSASQGGGMYNLVENLQLMNAILWGNAATSGGPQIYNSSGTPVISYSNIQGSGGSGGNWDSNLGIDGGGNLDANPLFINPASGDLHLDFASPAIDAGNNLSVTATTDLDGLQRFSNILTVPDTGNGTPPIVDMGAYEAQGTATLYAIPNGLTSGACESWPNACTLTYTLSIANGGDQIWVQEGLHKPGATVSDTFALVNGVAVYGGFDGTETGLDQRDWESNITVLSGDIDNNDLTDPNGVVTNTANIVGDNAYHVVSSTGVLSDTILDGFVITAGQANGASPNHTGGGMYNSGGDPTLVNIHFYGNFAHHSGGGMLNLNASNPSLENVIFSNNTVFQYGGGGMMNISSSPILTNITFNNNSAGSGGGMSTINGSPTLENVTFNSNFAGDTGGGMNIQLGNPTLINVTFRNNTTHNTFAISYGGGVYNLGADTVFRNVIFDSNTADNQGGGISLISSDATLINVIFAGNTTTAQGGGMFISGGNPLLINVTLSANHAEMGGGIYNAFGSHSMLSNVILWGNTAMTGTQIFNYGSTMPTISYSNIEGSGGSGAGWDPALGIDAGGNIDTNPLFVDPISGNLHLELTSPAIDAGNNFSVTVTADLDGNPRFVNIPTIPDTGNGTPPIVDMGAYEAQPINIAPTFTSTPVLTATQDVTYTYAITTIDLNGDLLTITAPTLPAWLTFTDNGDGTASLIGTPNNANVGNYPFLLHVADSEGLVAEQAFTLTVTNVNDAPAITSLPITSVSQDTPYTYTITTTDPDLVYGDALIITVPTLPSWLTLTDNGDGTATLTGVPTAAEVGQHTISLRVTDSQGLFLEQTFTITVTETGRSYFIYLPIAVRNQE